MRVTACICTHDRPKHVTDCLEGLRQQTVSSDQFLPESLGCGDPAVLLPLTGWGTAPGPHNAFGFMPHFESTERGAWKDVANLAGIGVIDARDDPVAVVTAIARCKLLISEALHGVIVADALRVPWIAIEPRVTQHRSKCHDWADTLGLTVEFRRLPSSSLLERLHASSLASLRMGQNRLEAHATILRRIGHSRFVTESTHALAHVAPMTPQLSEQAALQRCQARMLTKLAVLRTNPRRAPISPPV